MKYKHIIFDIDGTMLDSAYADLMALQKVIWEFLNKKYEIFYQIDERLCFHFYKNEIFFINLGFAELVEKYNQKEKALAMEKSRKAKEFLMPLEDIRGVFVRNKEKKIKKQNFSKKNIKNRRFY